MMYDVQLRWPLQIGCMPLLPMQITQVEFRLQELVTNFISSIEEGENEKPMYFVFVESNVQSDVECR
jgi:hypothetical protein